jgi:flagellum-specific peptidoglycan hydrolase FlgJ
MKMIEIPILAAAPGQLRAWARSRNAAPFFIELAPLYCRLAAKAGVDPAVAYCQAGLETGMGRFGGVIDETFHNPCGMKKTSGGGDYEKDAHMRFTSWEEGVQAQIDHLALYAGADGYPKAETPDPRHFASICGTAKTVGALTGRWASNPKYAEELAAMINAARAVPAD